MDTVLEQAIHSLLVKNKSEKFSFLTSPMFTVANIPHVHKWYYISYVHVDLYKLQHSIVL